MDKHKNKLFVAAAQAAATRERFLNAHTVRTFLHISRHFLLSTLLARATIFGGFAPFGAAMAGALCATGGGIPAVIGAFFGYLFLRPGDPQSVAYAASALLTLCTAHVFSDSPLMRQRWFMPLTTTLSTGACTFVFLPDISARWLALFTCSLLLTAAACWFYTIALSPPKDGVVARPAAFLVLTATLLLSASDLMLFGKFAPARAAAVLVVMGAACLCGSAMGAAVGVVFGMTMDAAAAGGAYFTCLYAFAALAAGAFRGAGRRLFALFFSLAAGCAALLGMGGESFLPSIYEVAVAALLFAALPSAFWEGASETLLPEQAEVSDATARLRQSSRRRAGEAAQAFYEMYLSMMSGAQYGRASADEESRAVFDTAAERVCRKCSICAYCWQKDYVSTLGALDDAAVPMLRRGRAEATDFPLHFSSRCIHFPQLLTAINTEITALLLRRQYRRQLDQERSRSRGQYAQLGELVAQAMSASEPPAATGREMSFDVAMGFTPKEGERLCGDSVTYFQSGGSLLYMLLSDGMGSGREAARESQMTLRLLEQFLKAGIDAEPALKTLNGALNLRSDDQGSFTTIDLLSVDLSRREAALYKYGAAPTYIKRQGTVRRLTGKALPAGLQEADRFPPPDRFPLEEDTFVLMISDGVAESGDDIWLQDLLAGWHGEDPHVLVSLVLRECRARRGGDDDCSALCLYLLPGDRGRREV